MFGKTRSRMRGKPFKLFSDELPNGEYDDPNEGSPFREAAEEPRRGRGKKKRMQSFNDRLSLPSLGTPERDDVSVTMSDSRISSGRSNNQNNVLSPDLEELHNRIRQRNRVKDNGPKFQHGIGLPRRSTTLKLGAADRPIVVKRETFIRGGKIVDNEQKEGIIETHFDRYENAFTEEFGKINNRNQLDDESVKHKSILQQLLDASARDFNKRKQINDGLIANPRELLHRSPSDRLSRLDIRHKDTPPPSDSTPGSPFKTDDSKRGILKRESNKDRHSVRVPKMPKSHGNSPKPRLVHHDEIEDFEDYASRYVESPGGVISVHCDVPRNKMNDILLLPNKRAKQKRVYFKDNDEFVDIPSNNRDESRSKGLGNRNRRRRKSSPYPNDDVDIKFETYINTHSKEDMINDTLTDDTKGLSRSRSQKPVSYKPNQNDTSDNTPTDDTKGLSRSRSLKSVSYKQNQDDTSYGDTNGLSRSRSIKPVSHKPNQDDTPSDATKGLSRSRSLKQVSNKPNQYETIYTTATDDTKGLSRSRSLKPVSYKPNHRSARSSPYQESIRGHEVNKEADTSIGVQLDSKSDNMSNPLRDLFSADMYYGDESSVFSTPSPRKELQFIGISTDTALNSPNWRGSKTPIPAIHISIADNMNAESTTPSHSETPKLSSKLRRADSESVGKQLNIPTLVMPDGIHINDHFFGSRNPEAIGLDELPDDFDLSDLPEDIDRSLTGVELIKAYRLWDRERKAFPSGLRKIEIPFDPRDFILSKLRNANAKSHRTPNPKQEVKVTLV